MHHHAVFTSLHRGTPLAASVDSRNTDRLAWVGVYPLDLERQTTREFLRNQGVQVFPLSGRAYRIRSFEVQSRLIEGDVSIGETELENESSAIVFSDGDLLIELEKRGVPVERLELPYKSNYPI